VSSIKNVENLSVRDIQELVSLGGKFVVFEYCISLVVMSFQRNSSIYFIRPDEGTISSSIPYSLLSFFLGWWGIPWGIIYTFGSLYTNFSGGKDVTYEVMSQITGNANPYTPPAEPQQGYNIPSNNSNTNNNNNNNPTNGGYNIPR
jgi:hypothetical protein